jgi:hypothetical protein
MMICLHGGIIGSEAAERPMRSFIGNEMSNGRKK